MILNKVFAFCPFVATAILFVGSASGNLIVNGSFESNTAESTIFNMLNSSFDGKVNNVTAFGGAEEIDLITFGGGFGLDPVDGNWHLAVVASITGTEDAFSFDLTSSLSAGVAYNLSFWASANSSFGLGAEPLEVGLSSTSTSFGTLVFNTGILPTDTWTFYSTTFVAPVSGNFLTVRPSGAPISTWVHLDDFQLSAVPEPGSLALLSVVGSYVLFRRRNRV